MRIEENYSLEKHNTFHLPVKARWFMEYMNEEELEYYAKLGDLEEELQGQFFRIHKGYLVNLACIDEYNKTEVTLVNGDKLLISKYKYPDFVKAYLRYMQ